MMVYQKAEALNQTNNSLQQTFASKTDHTKWYTVCGSLNVIGPHNLIGGGTFRKSELVGVGVVLLEVVCHLVEGFEASYAQDTAQCLSLLPVAFCS